MKKVFIFFIGVIFIHSSSLSQNEQKKFWELNQDLTFNVNGNNWQLNNNGSVTPSIVGSVLTLTTNSGNQAASAFYKYPLRVNRNFIANFTYTPSGDIGADGAAFILQSSVSGANALGANGGNLGVYGITPEVAVIFNLYTDYTVGMNISLNGSNFFGPYNSVSPVVLNSGNPIDVTVRYSSGTATLYVTLSERNTAHTYSTSYTGVNIVTYLGATAWVGFSGATGGSQSTQTITNFIFK